MLTSIPVKDFIDPPRGSRAYNAIARAVEIQPDIILIGQHGWERYYRVKSPKRNRHLVTLWTDHYGDAVSKCDCEAHYLTQDPQPCLHIAAALIWEATSNERSKTRPREKGTVSTNGSKPKPDKVKGPTRSRIRPRVVSTKKRQGGPDNVLLHSAKPD